MKQLREMLEQEGCSPEFIEEAMGLKSLYNGDLEAFIETVEIILAGDEQEYEEDDVDDNDDPISRSERNYNGEENDYSYDDYTDDDDEYESDEGED
ncbi:MAG: hypothetical protein PHN38_04115 [Sulfurospirillaceae bacterium]|nr:hypothetical protein [Sulfurospirillaceae bacterium]